LALKKWGKIFSSLNTLTRFFTRKWDNKAITYFCNNSSWTYFRRQWEHQSMSNCDFKLKFASNRFHLKFLHFTDWLQGHCKICQWKYLLNVWLLRFVNKNNHISNVVISGKLIATGRQQFRIIFWGGIFPSGLIKC
jgi:hypothetical protein